MAPSWAILAVFFASLGGFLGLPALSEPYLGASWGQVGLQDRSQNDFWSKNDQISGHGGQLWGTLGQLWEALAQLWEALGRLWGTLGQLFLL